MDQLSGTRKLASLASAPANWYKNYRLYHAGLVVRLHQTRAKQSSQTVSGLVEVARELSDPSLVCFGLLFEDIVSQVLSPFNKGIQRTSLEAATLFEKTKGLQMQLTSRIEQIHSLRRMVCICSLMTAYLPAADLARWCFAQQFSQTGRYFPHFVRHLFEPVTKCEFQRCKLQVVQEILPTDVCVHPRCQCVKQTGLGKKILQRLKLRRRYRQVAVPEWVHTSPITTKAGDDIESGFIARFRFAPMEQRAPASLQGVSRFVRSANKCRCIASKCLAFGSVYLYPRI